LGKPEHSGSTQEDRLREVIPAGKHYLRSNPAAQWLRRACCESVEEENLR
jgi:hypothetical protein